MIDDFNLSLNSKVKQFRLGSDLSNGAYIRKFDGDVSTFYADASHKNGIYINTETLEKYIGISEHLFGDILDNIVKCDLSENEDGKRFLMTANTGYKNSYSNHITELISSNGSIQILNGEETPITLHFNSQFDPDNSRGIMNSFSHIPAVLSKVFKYISERQTYDIENESEFYASHSVKITTTSVNSEGKT
jgi:hypothetical protein